MSKYILTSLSLFSICFCAFIPMKENKNFKEDVCEYADDEYTFVKPCGEGKYCAYSNVLDIGFCKKVENKIKLKTMNDDCTSDFDCESGLECKSNKCSYSGTCGSDYSPVRSSNGYWGCKKDEYKGLCYYEKKEDSSPSYSSGAEYFQVCGKITFDKSSESGDHVKYKPIKIESVYRGSVDDGEFVLDVKACKSGYALYFYPDGSLIDPGKSTYQNNMYKKCVTINEFDKRASGCVIKYDNDKIYNVNQLNGKETMSSGFRHDTRINFGASGSDEYLCDEPLVRQEMWDKYLNAYNVEKQKECEKNTDIDDKLTCDDNEIRKWSYFYDNPEIYIAYYDEKNKNNDVVNYLLQRKYNAHISSGFLAVKFIYCLLLLLFSF